MAEASYIHAAQQVHCLLEDCPKEAAGILARFYRDFTEVKCEIDSILLLSRNGQQDTSRSPQSITVTIPPQIPARPSSSHHSGSPPPLRARSNVRPLPPLSPPSSLGARSTRGTTTPGEWILLVNFIHREVEEKPVLMRSGQCQLSLIREDIADEQSRYTSISQGNEYRVLVPQHGNPDTCIPMHVSESITLTWRRPNSGSTHRTTFFLIPKGVLDTDVILGYEDSGEGSPGVYTRSRCDLARTVD